ncbi:hypothetical protein B0A52_01491 [Exophiala mesophila]|uniref:Nitroreductase domain-containing protein n=1 Tax=Exophiala mesophila TaxID=212818 RepID=A0A438NF56_EXOME|nr:hypothetical protein B0A52_01491 [Exophiala mesophila]
MSPSDPIALDQFLTPIEQRLSNYTLTNTSPIPDSKIQSIVEFAIKHAPSTFNVQSARAVILLRADHEKLWDIGDEELQKTLPQSSYNYMKPKIQGFRAAYGTVLWFEDQDALDTLKGKN